MKCGLSLIYMNAKFVSLFVQIFFFVLNFFLKKNCLVYDFQELFLEISFSRRLAHFLENNEKMFSRTRKLFLLENK